MPLIMPTKNPPTKERPMVIAAVMSSFQSSVKNVCLKYLKWFGHLLNVANNLLHASGTHY